MASHISVLTTLYNHERFIVNALQSAIGQSFPPSQIVVLDDASTDNSLEAARSVSHPAIQILAEKFNLGGSGTVKGLSACNGDMIAILNSDDAWAPEKIEKQTAYLATSPKTGAVFTHVKVIDESGTSWPKYSNQYQQAFNVKNRSRHEWLRHFFLVGNPFCASSALIRRDCFDRLGTLDGRYVQLQDLDMWIRIAIAGYDLHVIEEPYTYYRSMRNGTNMSSDSSKVRAISTFEYAKILRSYWKLSSLQELTQIFPELIIADRADDSLILFYLAQHAAKQPTLHHQLFALETMSQWGGNQAAMSLAMECHRFGHPEYMRFFMCGPYRRLLRLNARHQLNSLARKILPYSVQQSIKSKLMRKR